MHSLGHIITYAIRSGDSGGLTGIVRAYKF